MFLSSPLAGVVLLAGALLGIPGTAYAQAPANATVPTCNAADLVEAVHGVNMAGGGTITLRSGCVYTLTAPDNEGNGLPVITTPIVINGNGDIIKRDRAAPGFRIFEIGPPGGALTLNSVTVSNAHAVGNGRGGGIWLNGGGSLKLTKSTVIGNTANSVGGGIANDGGTVTIKDSSVKNNTANNGFVQGGGIFSSGTLTMTDSTVAGNQAAGLVGQGGGIYNAGGKLALDNTPVTFNAATTTSSNPDFALGGGIVNTYAGGPATATLTSSPVTGNTAQGIGDNKGAGAGIVNASSTLMLNNTRVTGNSAFPPPHSFGGGIWNIDGTVTLVLSTVTGNFPNNCSGNAILGCVN